MFIPDIFNLQDPKNFERVALHAFKYQYHYNNVYREFCDHLNYGPKTVNALEDIPYLPISFFKTHRILTQGKKPQVVFASSGSTGDTLSKHYVSDPWLYINSFKSAFKRFYGDIRSYTVLALLPSYLERADSSLVYMADRLIKQSRNEESGFYLNDIKGLAQKLKALNTKGGKILLLGVSFALLDLADIYDGSSLKNTVIMETGGMKGRRKEMVREELHQTLCKAFGQKHIHSEYGMTELLSQAYSKGEGKFSSPPWMKISVRDSEDPTQFAALGKTGGINVIDLANWYSCPFIATEDLGRLHHDGHFEVLGRFDTANIRGCNLMVL